MLLKIGEHRDIGKLTNASVTGISESRLEDSVLTLEIQINEYEPLHCDKSRHEAGFLATLEIIFVIKLSRISLKTHKKYFLKCFCRSLN